MHSLNLYIIICNKIHEIIHRHASNVELLPIYVGIGHYRLNIPPLSLVFQAWRLPFRLSTSQTPAYVYELGADVVVEHSTGGFLPTDRDGYGVSYVPHTDDLCKCVLEVCLL